VTSEHVHGDVLLQEPALIDPNAFERIEIENNETAAVAWLWLPRAHSRPD